MFLLLLLLVCAGEGILAIKAPWPCMMRTVYGDHERFEQTYFSAFKGYYFTGERASVHWLAVSMEAAAGDFAVADTGQSRQVI